MVSGGPRNEPVARFSIFVLRIVATVEHGPLQGAGAEALLLGHACL